MSSQLKQDLDKTYLTLELHGWCQGIGGSSIPEFCLEEAVALAVGRLAANWADRDNARQTAVLRALAAQLVGIDDAASLPDHRLTLWRWNDQFGRTVEEVKTLIKKAWEVAE